MGRHSTELLFNGPMGADGFITSGDAGYSAFNAPAGSNRAALIFILLANPVPQVPASITMGGQTVNRVAQQVNNAAEGSNDSEVGIYYANEATIAAFSDGNWSADTHTGSGAVFVVWFTDIDQTAGVVTTAGVGGTTSAQDVVLSSIQSGDLCYVGAAVAYESVDRITHSETSLHAAACSTAFWGEVFERVADATSETITVTFTTRAAQSCALGAVLRPAAGGGGGTTGIVRGLSNISQGAGPVPAASLGGVLQV